MSERIPTACLLLRELATNAMVYPGTGLDVSVATHLQALRVTVRGDSPGRPQAEELQLDLTGEGVALIADLSRAWGVLPTADGGKIAWAVFDAHPDQAAPKTGR